ncbi:MAG: glycosyltransferase family 39 protein [Planctomycetota bacterium]
MSAATPDLPVPEGHPATRLPRLLLALALVLTAAAGIDGITLGWNQDPERGLGTSAYVAPWVQNHVEHGLGVTLGAPVVHVGTGTPPAVMVNWHHPAFYPLWLAAFAAVLGDQPWVLRLAHLLLFLPSVPALYLLVRRHGNAAAGAAAALLYAACPYTSYFGLMVIQDGITMGLTVITCWLFQRHLDDPAKTRWWWPGLAFFLCGVNDIPGYFIGLSLFLLALLHRDKARALRAVAAMFAVSVAAFAATAVHYGLFLGGPLGFLRAMRNVSHFESGGAETVTAQDFVWQWQRILVEERAWPVVLLALVGPLAAAGARVPGTRRLVAIAAIVGLPGVVNCVAFPAHAPHHIYWPLTTFLGFAVAAALAPVAAIALRAAGGARRWLGTLLLAATVAALGHGIVGSHALIGGKYDVIASEHRLVERTMAPLRGCKYVLTTARTGYGSFFGSEYIVGGIDTPELLDVLLLRGKASGMRDDVGFVLGAALADSPLRRRLQQLGQPIPGDGAILFRFPVPQ